MSSSKYMELSSWLTLQRKLWVDLLRLAGVTSNSGMNCSLFLAEKNILGPLNRGIYVLFSGLDIERLVLSAGPVGWVFCLSSLMHPYTLIALSALSALAYTALLASSLTLVMALTLILWLILPLKSIHWKFSYTSVLLPMKIPELIFLLFIWSSMVHHQDHASLLRCGLQVRTRERDIWHKNWSLSGQCPLLGPLSNHLQKPWIIKWHSFWLLAADSRQDGWYVHFSECVQVIFI